MNTLSCRAAAHRWRRLGLVVAFSLVTGTLGLHTALASTSVTFDDPQGHATDDELDGQLPAGVIDWGTGGWYLSGPWGQFSNNSVSFLPSVDSASFSLLSGGRLVRIDAFNGAMDSPTTVTLSCGDQHKQVDLDPGQVRTIDTGWSGSCPNVTVSSSNGWETNFSNLVLE